MTIRISSTTFKVTVGLCIFLAVLCLKFALTVQAYDNFFSHLKSIRRTDDPYALVAPLVGIDSPSALSIGHYKSVYNQVREYAAGHPDEIDSYGFYYRDLNSSQWFGINENDEYVPASLLKIALAFVVLKQEAENPHLAAEKRIYTSAIARINTSEPFLEPSGLVVGHAYTTQELLEKMLIDSDNGAKDLLYSEVDGDFFLEIFRLLGVKQPSDPLKYTLSPKDFALFFRMLYGGTYLSSSDSERLLEILTRVKFTEGIVAGVPSQITVAHKYGTFTTTDANGNKTGIELHDCGVVYDPENPYIICVMTKGQDADRLSRFISDVSAIVYKNVDAHTL